MKNKKLEPRTHEIKISVGTDHFTIGRFENCVEINCNGGDSVFIPYHGWPEITQAIGRIGIEIARDNYDEKQN